LRTAEDRQSFLRIALLSGLVLFLEMLLVRWIGTELRVFAYLQNAVLVAAFLGLGLGSRNARLEARLLPAILSLLLIAMAIKDPLAWEIGEGVTVGLTTFEGSPIWGSMTGAAMPSYLRSALVAFALLVTFTFGRSVSCWDAGWTLIRGPSPPTPRTCSGVWSESAPSP
jgi:hypothetical protein